MGLAAACGSSSSSSEGGTGTAGSGAGGAAATGGEAGAPAAGGERSGPARPGTSGLLRVDGDQVVDEAGQPVLLRGVAFGNEVWFNDGTPRFHHQEADFGRVAAMGMNVVRFYLNHARFEDPASPGTYRQAAWDWVDTNVEWARQHGVYLMLNMHIPPGGFQSLGEGDALWEDTTNQDRLTALWTAIAARYADEPVIAGYDLVNEPIPTESKAQWQALANRIAASIRTVDQRHIITVERALAVGETFVPDSDQNFFRIDDANALYEFHFYEPFDYTHQLASWLDMPEGGPYPDPTRSTPVNDVEWVAERGTTPLVASGDTDWTYYESPPQELAGITNGDLSGDVVQPAVECGVAPNGIAYFDDMAVEEVDADGNAVRTVISPDTNNDAGWTYWSEDDSGTGAATTSEGREDSASLEIGGANSFANLGAWRARFVPEPGKLYKVSGWIKGVSLDATARCRFKLDIFHSNEPILMRNKEYLATQLDTILAWSQREGVPVYLGEFGAIRATFENDRGGVAWVRDMLDLLADRRLHFTYHTYHEPAFGIFHGSSNAFPDPASANQPLIDLFTEKLADGD